jgi:hypothetical protein
MYLSAMRERVAMQRVYVICTCRVVFNQSARESECVCVCVCLLMLGGLSAHTPAVLHSCCWQMPCIP